MDVLAFNCINVYSNTNPWIDFVVILHEANFSHAENIINEAYNIWWSNEEVGCNIPLAEYIEMKLRENKIEYEIYFKSETEEE